MKIVGLDHVQLVMPPGGEERARAFYGGLLGLREVPKPAAIADRSGAWFEWGPVRIHLGVEPGFRPSRKAHAALLVEGFDDLVARLRGAGCEVIDAEPVDGIRRSHLRDPFGNDLELVSRAPPASA